VKAGIFILSFLFVVLTIQPAFIKWNNVSCAKKTASERIVSGAGCIKAAEKKCSSKTASQQVPVKRQTDDPCSTCNAENTNWLIEESVSSFPADAWHPPELFMRL
jgi:hypothetical protein